MAAYQYEEFERRMRRISRRHAKLSRGYVASVNKDGLVVAEPVRSSVFPHRGLLLVLAIVMLFKAFLHAQLGADAYDLQVQALAGGSVIEQVGAWLMAADPITVWLSDFIGSLVR